MATPQMGDIDSFVGLLSTVQFKSELDWASYILIMIMAGLGTFIGSYLKKKGERFATKKDFDSILRELEANTKTVEDIRSKFSEKNWINQQVWLKKQEAYASIFTLLLNIKKYVSHQASAYDEWTDINHYHPYFSFSYTPQDEARLKREWEIDKKPTRRRFNLWNMKKKLKS